MRNKVQEVRWEKNWSQMQLSQKSTVPQSVICDIENNNRDPHISTALKLARALSVSVESLFQL